MEKSFNSNVKQLDIYSKESLLKNAYHFFYNPFNGIDRENLKKSKSILNEIEEWELNFGANGFSSQKNNAILVAYLSYRFGELLGVDKDDLANIYISGLIQSIGKKYICDDDFGKAYEYISSPLKKGDEGFDEIEKALKTYPSKTLKYLEENTKFNKTILSTSTSFHSVYSQLFSDGYPGIDRDITQLDMILWFSNSLSAIAFSSSELLKRDYNQGKYVSLIEALEILRDQTETKIPIFWNKASNVTLMSVIFALSLGFTSPTKAKAANYSSQEVVNLVNEYRNQNGLELLEVNLKLVEAARKKTEDMFEKGYWNHVGPDGETAWNFLDEAGYAYTFAGENLAKGFKDVNKMNQAWIDSPTHRENIINPDYSEIGVAVIDGNLNGKEVTLVVQIFASEKETLQHQIEDSYDKVVTNLMDFVNKVRNTFTKH